MKLRAILIATILLVLPLRGLAAALMFACAPVPAPLAAVQAQADKGQGEHCHAHAVAAQDAPADNDANPCANCVGDCCTAGIADPRQGERASVAANQDRFVASQRRFASADLEDPGRPPLSARR